MSEPTNTIFEAVKALNQVSTSEKYGNFLLGVFLTGVVISILTAFSFLLYWLWFYIKQQIAQ